MNNQEVLEKIGREEYKVKEIRVDGQLYRTKTLTIGKEFIPKSIRIGDSVYIPKKGDWILYDGDRHVMGSGDGRVLRNSLGGEFRGYPLPMLELTKDEVQDFPFGEMRQVDFCDEHGVFIQWFFE